MFVHKHTQIFLLSSTIFHQITYFKDDLCRNRSKSLKSVKLVIYNHRLKSFNYTIVFGCFKNHVHNNFLNFDSSFILNPFAQSKHSMFNWQLNCTFEDYCFSYGCLWSKQCVLILICIPWIPETTRIVSDGRHPGHQVHIPLSLKCHDVTDIIWNVWCISYFDLRFF